MISGRLFAGGGIGLGPDSLFLVHYLITNSSPGTVVQEFLHALSPTAVLLSGISSLI